LQHVNVKLFADPQSRVNLTDAIPVFHRWIQARDLPEMLIDVADYSHVPGGPGVVLVGHEAIYGLDMGGNRLGLLYNRRTVLDGTPRERLQQAYEAALSASRRLEQEPEFEGKLSFSADEVEVVLNDRLLYPNSEETWQAVRGDVEAFFDGLYGAGKYSLSRATDPRDRFRVSGKRDF
jgi:hypothetical protein